MVSFDYSAFSNKKKRSNRLNIYNNLSTILNNVAKYRYKIATLTTSGNIHKKRCDMIVDASLSSRDQMTQNL